jgi:hypothetical protein
MIEILFVALFYFLYKLNNNLTTLTKRYNRGLIIEDYDPVRQVRIIVEEHQKYGNGETLAEFYNNMGVTTKYFDEFLEHKFKTIDEYRVYDNNRSIIELYKDESKTQCIKALVRLDMEHTFDEKKLQNDIEKEQQCHKTFNKRVYDSNTNF